MVNLASLRARWEAFASSSPGRYLLKGLRALFITGVIAYLVYRLSHIGWAELWTSLPQTPYFYLTVLAMYFTLPVAESFIYGTAWGVKPWSCLPILLRKRVLNADVMGYSGEVYLLAYARKNVDRPARELGLIIKDNLILSSIFSTGTALVLLTGLLLSGQVALDAILDDPAPGYVAGGAVALALAAGLVIAFRGAIFYLSGRVLARIAGLHATRFLLMYVLQVVQWWVVIPEAPFSAWATLLVVSVVTNRIPFLPSRDLVFAGAGIELAAGLGVPVAAVAGMLLVRSAIDRLLNLGFFAGTTLIERQRGAAITAREAQAFEPALTEETLAQEPARSE